MVLRKQKGSPRANGDARRHEAGQILLIVILVIIIASTVGLSLASRSIISLRTSTEEAESQKALAAAEAGIERAIQSTTPIAVQGNNPNNNSSYSASASAVLSSQFLINGGNVVPKGEGTDVWIVSHDSNGNPIYSEAQGVQFLNLYWGSVSEVCGTPTAPAAVEAIVVSRNKTTGEIKSYRYAYDSCSDRRSENNFTQADFGNYTVAGITFTNRTAPQDNLAKNVNDVVFVRVIPIYKDTAIGISACNYGGNNCTSLPIQGYVVNSTGTSGQANRKITVFKGYQQTYLPYLSYGLFVAN